MMNTNRTRMKDIPRTRKEKAKKDRTARRKARMDRNASNAKHHQNLYDDYMKRIMEA